MLLGLVLLAILLSPLFFIPIGIVLLGMLAASPLLASLRSNRGGTGGVPDTEQAAYDPVQDPEPANPR